MEYKLEVVILAVRDVDRSIEFYTKSCGFNVDVDYRPHEGFRVVQLTPPGSGCSIQIGTGLADEEPGTPVTFYVAVEDIEAAREELIGRGVDVQAIRRKRSVDDWQGDTTDGVDPQRRDYASFASFVDPDGNTWTLQEIGHPSPGATRS